MRVLLESLALQANCTVLILIFIKSCGVTLPVRKNEKKLVCIQNIFITKFGDWFPVFLKVVFYWNCVKFAYLVRLF